MSTTKKHRHADSAQLSRQWALLKILTESGRLFSVSDLARQLGTSKSSVARDLATIERHFPLIEEAEGKQKKRYRIERGAVPRAETGFGQMELLALHAAQKAVAPTDKQPFHGDMASAIYKIRAALAAKKNGGIDAIPSIFVPHERGYIDYSHAAEIIDDLVDAIAHHKVCIAHYRKLGERRALPRTVFPLHLLWHGQVLYLFCLLDRERERRTLAVHRIQEISRTDERFIPPKVDPAVVLRPAFGIYVDPSPASVEVVYSGRAAAEVEERIYHPDEEKERLPDGRLRYRLGAAAKCEVLAWVQSYGADAELVAPEDW